MKKWFTANFLVAKHTRTLLCQACQSPTPWTGSGPKLGPTVSVCDACVNRSDRGMDGDRGSGSGNTEDGDDDEEEEEEDGEDQHDDDEENGDRVHEDDDDSENQVVPLSLPPSSASSSSGSEESSGRRDGFSSTSFGFSNSSTTVENGRFSLNLPRFRVGLVISRSLHCSGRGKASTEECYSEDEIMDVAIVKSGRKKNSLNGWWADHVKNYIFLTSNN
ncbi:UNVERIFIED_CONTAM: hypothetical protein Sangu_0898900 [Sesamum angustifolium]|uniref:Uncharacterized protein n=1 Tax=Sesamum angustifolium TaxID=2727405 RepID=A0AAW2PC56_9LAMI